MARTRKFSDPVTQYARDVLAGAIVAGPHVRDACRRHIADLDQAPARGWTFDAARLQRILEFFPDVLRLSGGEWEGVPFELSPWQAFVVGSLFAWVDAGGRRRFRVAYIETGKGSGKSPLAAGIGHYMFIADDEPRAEIYAAAAKKDQAMVLFRDAVAMVQLSPALASHITRVGGQSVWNMAYDGSFFRAISSDDSQSGPRPHCALIDEIHEHRDDSVIEMLRAGFKGRRQPLLFMITNSGSDRQSVCWRYHDRACKIAAGALQDDRFFAYVCALDDADEPLKDPACWVKTNPNLGVSIGPEYLHDQVLEAAQMPAKQSRVLRLHFCKWVETSTPWISPEVWQAAQVQFAPDELLDGGELYLGIDLSVTTDLTAIAMVRKTVTQLPPTAERPEGSELIRFKAAVEFFTPADTVEERAARDRVPYDVWIREGYLRTTPGSELKYDYIAERLAQINGRAQVVAAAFDRYRMRELRLELEATGSALNLVEHPQGTLRSNVTDLWMPQSIETFEGALLERRIEIAENPVLTWNASAAMTESDRQLNRVFTKKKSTGRIDGVVALAMAIGAAQHLHVNNVPIITVF